MRIPLIVCYAALAVSTLDGSQFLAFDCPITDQARERTPQRILWQPATGTGLSLCGRNAPIVLRDRMLTLLGPVRSEEEKESPAPKAVSVAVADNVVNQREVTAHK